MEMKLTPVILSGGAGTRLWPLSREMYPKQLLALTGPQTMLQETAARLAGIDGARPPIVVCNEAHRFTVAEQLRTAGLPAGAILLEPVGRNTAPAVALAALQAQSLEPDAILVVAPADHVVRDVAPVSPGCGHGRRARRCRQARDLRHRRACARDRLWLHPPRRGAGPRLSRGPVHRKTRPGCGAPVRRERRLLLEQRHVRVQGARLLGASCKSLRPISSRRAKPPSRPPRRTWTSCASTRPPSSAAAAIRSTTRSWRRPAPPWCCPSRQDGAMSGPGLRYSMRCRRTRTAMCSRATCSCTIRTIATCTRPAVWSPPSGWTIM